MYIKILIILFAFYSLSTLERAETIVSQDSIRVWILDTHTKRIVKKVMRSVNNLSWYDMELQPIPLTKGKIDGVIQKRFALPCDQNSEDKSGVESWSVLKKSEYGWIIDTIRGQCNRKWIDTNDFKVTNDDTATAKK